MLGSIIVIAIGLFTVLGAVVHLRAIRAALKLGRLGQVEAELKTWPSVTIVVAACNEEETIEEAARSLLEIDYPNLELILVDDRSTDGTGEIVDKLAALDSRAKALHITELPENWLGKVHALHCGTELATGQYLVFTDADVHFAPAMLRRAVAFAEGEDLGHLGVLPALRGGTFLLDAAIAAFATGFLNALAVTKIGRPGSEAFAGVGAFGMVRKKDLDRTEGWPWLRMEVLDDLGLAMLIVKQAKARSLLIGGGDQLWLRWYADLGAMMQGLEKNGFVGLADFSIPRVLAMAIFLPILAIAPVAALLSFHPYLQALAIFFFATTLPLAIVYRHRIGHPILATILSVFAMPVLSLIVVRSAIKTLRAGGITWRGTFYSLASLKAGKRARI